MDTAIFDLNSIELSIIQETPSKKTLINSVFRYYEARIISGKTKAEFDKTFGNVLSWFVLASSVIGANEQEMADKIFLK